MKSILFIFLISAVIGLMDKVKFHFSQSWFSTITKPAWFVRWLNPRQYLIEKAPRWLAWLLARPLIGLNDFWHFLKFIMLQLIFVSTYYSQDLNFWAWMLVCNFLYGVIFEVVFEGCFNKKD